MDGKQRLDQVQNEVNDFHPLLHEIFKRMDLEQVSYNHGPNELGADFILCRRDSLLQQTYWIGVVVKLGAVRQDHDDVNRQIEECFTPRISPDGRAEILATEVWVVCSGEITTNARQKIAEKFRGRKVEFVSGSRVIQLIDRFLPDNDRSIPVSLQIYRDSQIEVMSRLDARTALIAGGSVVYICPSVSELRIDSQGDLHRNRTFNSLDEITEQIMKSTFVLVESGMGGGKSRLLRELMRTQVASDAFGDGKLIPAYISCTELKENFQLDIDAFLAKSLPQKTIDLVPTKIVFLDGLDELKLPAQQRAAALHKFISWAQNGESRRLVISTRPIDERESLGPKLQNICLLRIEQMKGKKALEFFASVCGDLDISAKVKKDLATSDLLRAFDASPIAYTLLAKVMTDNNEEVPGSIPELFAKYFELVLGRWEIDKGLVKQKEFKAVEACLTLLATALLESGRSEMPRSEATAIIKEYLDVRPIDVAEQRILEMMHERSLVLFYDQQVDVIGFRHKSFAEYFYALRLAREAVLNVRDDAFSPFWVGVFYFLAGLKRDCADLITSLSKIELQAGSRVFRLLNLGNILQAAYMTPTNHISHALRATFIEAGELFIDVREGRDGKDLSNFSVMQLLSLFRYIVADMYGYKYFQDALDDVICDLAVGPPNEVDALALFFACIAHREADGKLDFDGLISRHGDMLPLELKFAIKHEAKKFDAATRVVKKMEKNLKSNLEAKLKGGASDVVRRLYKAPIRVGSSKQVT